MPGWESLVRGQPLPVQVHACTPAQVIKYLAGAGDFNPVHFDPESAGLPRGGLLVPGRFKQACLGRLVSDWLCHRGFLRRLSCRYMGADAVGRPLTCKGEVRRPFTDGDRRRVELRLWTEGHEGRVTTVGTALVEWAPGGDPWPWP